MLISVFLLIFFHISSGNPVEVTFKNVTFHGYNMFTAKFKPTILYGNSLKDFIPNTEFDSILFLNQPIPVLYKDAVTDINELYGLIMDFCGVEDIRPGAFRNLSRLNRMSLKMNQIKKVENGVFNNLTLKTLDLSFNKISFIHQKAFNDMPEMFQINLASNRISEWNPEWFGNSPQLSVLNFENNAISELPAGSFKHLKKERYLTMELIFNENKISIIDPDAFDGIKQIHILSLNKNLLQTFDHNLLKNVAVKYLRLSNNSITCLDNLDEIFKATHTYIDYNPIDCECLKKIKKWCEKNHKNVGVANTKCPDDPNVIDIEEVREVAKDVFAINKITLVLPNDYKSDDKMNFFGNLIKSLH